MKLFLNWLKWCWKFKEIVPWSVRLVSSAKPTAEDIAAAKRFLAANPDIAKRGAGSQERKP